MPAILSLTYINWLSVLTLRLIDQGGPYPYRQDGTGPRRIIAGKNGERYYTPDHYRSFQRIEGAP
jgi:ribonuclease T1